LLNSCANYGSLVGCDQKPAQGLRERLGVAAAQILEHIGKAAAGAETHHAKSLLQLHVGNAAARTRTVSAAPFRPNRREFSGNTRGF
jgi:hypothetical protein